MQETSKKSPNGEIEDSYIKYDQDRAWTMVSQEVALALIQKRYAEYTIIIAHSESREDVLKAILLRDELATLALQLGIKSQCLSCISTPSIATH